MKNKIIPILGILLLSTLSIDDALSMREVGSTRSGQNLSLIRNSSSALSSSQLHLSDNNFFQPNFYRKGYNGGYFPINFRNGMATANVYIGLGSGYISIDDVLAGNISGDQLSLLQKMDCTQMSNQFQGKILEATTMQNITHMCAGVPYLDANGTVRAFNDVVRDAFGFLANKMCEVRPNEEHREIRGNFINIRNDLINNNSGREVIYEKLTLLNFCVNKCQCNTYDIMYNLFVDVDKEVLQDEIEILDTLRDKFLTHICKHFVGKNIKILINYFNEILHNDDADNFTFAGFTDSSTIKNLEEGKDIASAILSNFIQKTKYEMFWSNFKFSVHRSEGAEQFGIHMHHKDPENNQRADVPIAIEREMFESIFNYEGKQMVIYNAHDDNDHQGNNQKLKEQLINDAKPVTLNNFVNMFLQLIIPMCTPIKNYNGTTGSFFAQK